MNLRSLFSPRKWTGLFLDKGPSEKLSDEAYIRLRFFADMGKWPNLSDPKTYNEKLQWIKLHDRNPLYTLLSDKVRVREYVAQKLGPEYLIPLAGVWDSPEDIDFDALPEIFVLKCNHNSGRGMYICQDKAQMDVEKVKAGLRRGLQQDYFLVGREWPYKDIPRKIIGECFLEGPDGNSPEDYKIFCFNGEPKILSLHRDRFTGHTVDFYDTQWNLLDIQRLGRSHAATPFPKPELLEEMLRLSRILTEGIPHVRADWYICGGKIYFGELTFFNNAGFGPFEKEEDDLLLGSWIDIN